ncbi:pre-mRNA-splicing factor SYF2-like isoform X2 [Centruroides sculpturatus]|uniref:pre-mRNA-splicing factor SYF2-like isoform X2 n=1 Tax=Centruroides sculpturatus TaxID=218467 RepID=UPI000C6DE52C|nr:pre-mRNA-splicing factor SYF2-like isoform X2 [Centruroides sculpturatus]
MADVEAKNKRQEALKKFKELHMRRNEARKLNHQEVVEEDRRQKLPKNWETKQQWADWKLQEEEKRQNAAATGEDYDRLKLLEVGAEEAEIWERKKRKKNPDRGFSDYESSTVRQYHRLIKQFKPDMEQYEKTKQQLGEEAFYPTKDTIIHGLHKDSKEAIDNMVQDIERQIDKRSKYSRRRRFNDDADIDYINERNMNFNKKLERFYGKYTTDIKQNLERGTAV